MPPPTTEPCPTCGARREDLVGGLCPTCVADTLQSQRDATARAARADTPVLPAGFQFIETLGHGGMGQVHLVFQAALRRYVALKQIAGRWSTHPKARERFLREARAAAQLSHPGIVAVLDIGADHERVWYTMEFVEGGDLAQLLARRGGRVPWSEAVTIVEVAARAIDHAHRAGIAHRDLKPSNVLLDANGAPKIADFGLAWLAAGAGEELTITGEILGTPSYVAPERLTPTASDDARPGDVYALCALLFHLIAGRPPFARETPLKTLHAIASDPAPSLRATAPVSIPIWLDALSAHGLTKLPEHRIASAGELADALARRRRARGGYARRRRLALTATATLVALVGGFYVVPWRLLAEKTGTLAVSKFRSPLVAVLPFDFDREDPEVGQLAAGLQDELAGTLDRLSDMRVITAGSVRAAGIAHADAKAAAELLHAGVVLTGTVRKEKDRLRITVQLLDAPSGTVRLTKSYERRRTDLFNLQTDIATDVALALHAQRQPRSAQRNIGTSSRDPAAQRLFLEARAIAADAREPDADLRRASELFARAAEMDPDFALAFAQQSMTDTRLYQWGHDRSDARLARSLAAAQQALRLNPELPEAEIALALYFQRRSGDLESARHHIDRAFELAPRNAEALAARANLERRSGAFAEAAQHFSAALELDPFNGMLAYNAADTFVRRRDYAAADAIITAALQRVPGHVALTKLRGDLLLLWHGDLSAMRADLATRASNEPTPDVYVMHKIDWLVFEGRLADALEVLRTSTLEVLDAQSIYLTRDGYEAVLLKLAGDHVGAVSAATRALPRVSAELARRPDDGRVLLHAAQLHALLGDVAAAERLVDRTLTAGDLAAVDAFERGFVLTSYSILLAMARADDHARVILRRALTEPNQLSLEAVRLHPALARFANDSL